MARVHVHPKHRCRVDRDEALRRLQLRCIRELREAAIDGAAGGFTVTAELPWPSLFSRITAVANEEFAADASEEGTPAEWFTLTPL